MRDIKFRGQRKDNKKWVYGYFYEECGNTYIIENRQEKSLLNKNSPHLVIPKTVGQYTGLKDKNGKMIFEGDKVRMFIDIEECSDYISIEADGKNYVDRIISIPEIFQEGCSDDCEIIGKIHDNADLIGEK